MKITINRGKTIGEIYGIKNVERQKELLEKVLDILKEEKDYDEGISEIYKFARNCKEVGFMINYFLIMRFGANMDRIIEDGFKNLSEENEDEHSYVMYG